MLETSAAKHFDQYSDDLVLIVQVTLRFFSFFVSDTVIEDPKYSDEARLRLHVEQDNCRQPNATL